MFSAQESKNQNEISILQIIMWYLSVSTKYRKGTTNTSEKKVEKKEISK